MTGGGRWLWRILLGFGLAGAGAWLAVWLAEQKLAPLAGAVGAITGGFAPTLFEWLKTRGEAQDAATGGRELPGLDPASELGPARLLDPRRALVHFIGRTHELTNLIAWSEDGPPASVRLVTGPGGVGKTRLSVELCTRLNEIGWVCERVGDGAEAPALSRVRQISPGRVLLVVDYAETRMGLAELLSEVAADSGTVRVLLLARSAGEWWDRLGGEPAVRDLLADAYPGEPLPAMVSAELADTDLVSAAVPVFAAALGVAAPVRVSVTLGTPKPRILDLHAAALVAVLRAHEVDPSAVVRVDVAGVLGELLRHEERFWKGTAARAGLLDGPSGMTVATVRQIVAAGCLLGAASQDQAVALLKRVPGATVSVKVACWLRDLYPPPTPPTGGTGHAPAETAAGGPNEAEWLGLLQPDRLAEHHTITQLQASPELTAACLSDLDQRQALRAITLFGRASTDQTAAPLLERTLPLLEQVVADLPADVDLLTAISDAIPYPSVALAQADLAITRRLLDTLPQGSLPELRARWLNWLGATLSQTGRPADALPVTQEALAIRRELVTTNPRHFPALASTLSNLGIILSNVGRPADAPPVTQEAVAIRRQLATTNPHRRRPALADSLSNLGVGFSNLGRPCDALPVTQEAVAIRRELATTNPDRDRPDLATALSNLGLVLSNLVLPAEALLAAQEALVIRRELATTNPDRYRPDLADSLTNLGISLAKLGRPADALPVTQEAVAIRRELATTNPDRYRPDLAGTLANLGNIFTDLDHLADALAAEQEALAMWRELAATHPDRYRPDLASTLANLSATFTDLDRPADALPVIQEAIAIRRELATTNPDRYRPDLASKLEDLSTTFTDLDRPADALPVAREAVAIWREFATTHPDRYRLDLADSLWLLADVLDALGRAEEAEAVQQEVKRMTGLGS